MATQLFLLNTAPDTHLGTNNTTLLDGSPVTWRPRALGTARGSGVTTSNNTSTTTGPTTGKEVTIGAGGTFAEWISPPVSADVTISGAITGNIWADESAMTANVAINFFVEVVRATDNSLVTIVQSTRTTELNNGGKTVNNFTATPGAGVTVNRGDRIRLRIFGDDGGGNMAAGNTFQLSYNGTTAAVDGDTYISFTETFSFESAPGGSTIYLTDTASVVSTASVDREAWTSRGSGVVNDVTDTVAGFTSPIQITDTAGGTVVDWFTKQLTAFTLGGMAQANLRAAQSGSAQASLKLEIARVDSDGTNASVWGSWCIAPTGSDEGQLTASEVARTANVSGDDLAVSDGQRLRIRVYVDDFAAGQLFPSETVTFYYAGTSGGASGDSYVVFPQTLTEFSPPASGPKSTPYSAIGWLG